MERIPIKTISGIPGRDGLGLGGSLCDAGKHGIVMVYNLSDVPVEKDKHAIAESIKTSDGDWIWVIDADTPF